MAIRTDLSRDQILTRLRRLEAPLRAKGVTGLAIFGSRSRQDHRADSDLDVLVDIDPSVEFSLVDLARVQHIVQDATGLEAQAAIRSDIDTRLAERIADDLIKVF